MKSAFSLHLLLAIVVFSSSCLSDSEGLAFIPEETQAIVSINVRDLAEKSNFDEWDQLAFVEAASEEVKNESKRLSRRLDRLREDPASAGMDLRKDVYIFASGEGSREQYMCAAVDMLDFDDFEEFMKGMLDETSMHYEHKKVNDYRVYLVEGGRLAAVYDKKRILWIWPVGRAPRNTMIAVIKDLTALSKKDQLIRNKDFRDFIDNTSDLSCWVSGKVAENAVSRRELKRLEEELGYSFSENSMAAHLTFEQDQISLVQRSYLGTNTQAFMAKWQQATARTVDDDLLEILPGDPAIAGGLSFGMDMLREALEEEERLGKYRDLVHNEPSLEALLAAMDGDMVFDFYGFKEVEEVYTDYESKPDSLGEYGFYRVEKTRTKKRPMMALALGLESGEQFEVVLQEALSTSKITPIDDGAYYRVSGGSTNLFVAHNDDHALISSDNELITAFIKDGEVDDNLADTDTGSEIDASAFYAMVDLDADRFSSEIEKEFGSRESASIDMADDLLKRLVLSTEEQNAKFVLEFHPGQGNSLWRLIELIDEGYSRSKNH